MNVFADDCCRIQQLHRPSDVHGVHPHPHLDLRPPGQVDNRRSCRVTHVSYQGFLSHSTPDHSWKRGRNSLKAVHSSKIPWNFGLTWGKFFVFLYIVAIEWSGSRLDAHPQRHGADCPYHLSEPEHILRNPYTGVETNYIFNLCDLFFFKVETFFNSQGFSQITIQPEFPDNDNLTR